MAVLGLVLLFTAMIAFQVPNLVKNQMWRDLISFAVLVIIGMVLGFSQVLGLSLPNPLRMLEKLFAPITSYLVQLFG